MGETLTNSCEFYGELLANHEQLLERHYHHLTRVVRPHLFYGWLRAKGVFTHDDQEEVENMYITTCLKAGRLIDVIKTKGRAGFVAFMEVIEYEYPELFVDITGKQPRTPPHEFCPDAIMTRKLSSRRNRTQAGTASADVLTMIGDLTYTLTQALALKSEQLKKLNLLIEHMKIEHEQEAEDNASMYRELQAFRETVEELNTEKDTLNQRIRQMTEQRDLALQQCSELRELKDSFMDQCHQLRVNYDKMALDRSSSGSSTSSATNQSGQIPKFVKPEFSSVRTVKQWSEALSASQEMNVTWPAEVLDTLRLKFHQKKEMWKEEKEMLTQKLNEYEAMQENSAFQWMQSITQIKTERDQVLQQLDDLKKQYLAETAKNERLSIECRQYVEQFKRMEETIDNLKREIDQRNRQSSKLLERGILQQMKESFHTIDDDDDNDEDIPGGPNSSQRHKSEARDSNSPTGSHRKLERTSPISLHLTSGNITPTNVQLSTRSELRERRKASFIGVCPFVVYAPERVQQPLHSYLLSQTTFFDDCVYDDVNASRKETMLNLPSPGQEVIHEKFSADGRKCLRLTVDKLKKCMSEGKVAILLSALPLTSIDTMRRQGVHPVVVVIKFRNEFECSELSALEEALDHHSNGLFECIEIDVSLAGDFQKFCAEVRSELMHLVQKYTFLMHCGNIDETRRT